jgi:hypothetical protein
VLAKKRIKFILLILGLANGSLIQKLVSTFRLRVKSILLRLTGFQVYLFLKVVNILDETT